MVHLIFAFQVNLLLGVIARFLRMVDTPGMVAGVAAGTVVLHWAGAAGYAPFAACVLAAGAVVWLRRRPQADAEQQQAPAAPSLGQVAACCLVPTVLAASWDALPDPQLARVGAVAGFASALAAVLAGCVASNPEGTQRMVAGKRGGTALAAAFTRALGGAGAVAVGGVASGAIHFREVWIVLLSVSVSLVLVGIGNRIASRVMSTTFERPGTRRLEFVGALIATVSGSVLGVGLAYVSRS